MKTDSGNECTGDELFSNALVNSTISVDSLLHTNDDSVSSSSECVSVDLSVHSTLVVTPLFSAITDER